MQIEKSNSFATMASDIDCVSILNKLILLTEQYKRLNELLENKQNMLKQRAINLQKRRLKHKCDMQKMWTILTQIETNNTHEAMLIGQPTAVHTDTNWYNWINHGAKDRERETTIQRDGRWKNREIHHKIIFF